MFPVHGLDIQVLNSTMQWNKLVGEDEEIMGIVWVAMRTMIWTKSSKSIAFGFKDKKNLLTYDFN
jgi:hypothetical protein